MNRRTKRPALILAITSIAALALSACTTSDTSASQQAAVEGANHTDAEAFELEVETIEPINNTDLEAMTTCNRPAGSGVILSFDDKGSPKQVQDILDVLDELNWRAAFFPVGEWAVDNWELIQQMQKEGHIVGSHTMTHPDLLELFTADPDQFYSEIHPLKDMATTDPMLLRPPYGSGLDDPEIGQLMTERNYQLCGWTADTNDWRGGTAEELLERVMEGYEYSPEPLQPDGIVLAHMQGKHSVEFVRLLAAELDTLGWSREALRP